MLDHNYQPSARHLARLRMSATARNLPPVFADIAAQRPKMTVARLEALAPTLAMIAELAKTNRLNSEELEKVITDYMATVGDDVPATDPAVESLARESILNLIADRDGGMISNLTPAGNSVGRSWDQGDGLRAKLVDGLTAQIAPSHKPTMGRDFASMSMGDMVMELARSRGARPANAAAALRMDATGYHGTSDFPLIVADSLSNAVGIGMQQAMPELARASRQVERTTYHQGRSLTLSSTTIPQEISQSGEISFGSMDEKGELLPRVRDFGIGFALTQAAIVNNQTGLLSDISSNMQRGATERLRLTLLEPLQANAGAGQNMADGNPVFTVGRGNTIAVGTVLSVASLSVARTALRNAKGSRGETFALKPWAIVTSPAQETLAQQVLASLQANQVSNVNPFGGALELIIEPGLTSQTAWYLLADPAFNDGLTHAFLSGQKTPIIESRPGWNTLGMEFRLIWSLDAKFVETATWFRNPGA